MSEITWMNAPVLIGLIALAMALVRVVERLLDTFMIRRKNGKKSVVPRPAAGCNGMTPEEHAALMRLDEMHSEKDQDGIPLWYFPRSLAKTMSEMVKIQDKIAVRLRDIVKAQENLNKRMERVEDNTSRISVPRGRS